VGWPGLTWCGCGFVRSIREKGAAATSHAQERHLCVAVLQLRGYAKAGPPAPARRVPHPPFTPSHSHPQRRCHSLLAHSETEVVIHALSAAMEKVPALCTSAVPS
jgi:hypothetical protein